MSEDFTIIAHVDSGEGFIGLMDIFPENIIKYISIKSDTNKTKKGYFCEINIEKTEDINIFSENIARWMLVQYEDLMIEEVFRSYFCEFQPEDTSRICDIAKENMKDAKLYHEKMLVKNLSNYLDEDNDKLILTGFFRFRNQEYRRYIEKILFDAVDDYFEKNKYKEFVALIRDYLKFSQSLEHCVHIIFQSSTSYRMYNSEGQSIVIKSGNEMYFTKEDKLISEIVTLAPKTVILHGKICDEWLEAVKLLKDIFEDNFKISDE